jgi:hypothetical protein
MEMVMTDIELNFFQVGVRVIFAIAVASYAIVGFYRLIRYLSGMIAIRPRVVVVNPDHELARRRRIREHKK